VVVADVCESGAKVVVADVCELGAKVVVAAIEDHSDWKGR
jgi:hypothetical protein